MKLSQLFSQQEGEIRDAFDEKNMHMKWVFADEARDICDWWMEKNKASISAILRGAVEALEDRAFTEGNGYVVRLDDIVAILGHGSGE